MVDVLCVVAHADDESFGAGALLSMYARHGKSIVVAALADGVSSRVGVKDDAAERRRVHFNRACAVLNAQSHAFETFADQRSDELPQLLINRSVESLIGMYEPSVVVTHSYGDLNHDHEAVARAVLVATRRRCPVFCMSPEDPNRWGKWEPTFEWSNGEDLETKVRACLCYEDEIRDYPHPRSERAIRERTVEQFMEIR